MADYTLSVEVIGSEQLKAALSNVSSVARNEITKAVYKAALQTEHIAKELAPHDQGPLRDSIHAEPPQITPTNVEAHVGTGIKYGRAQEYGTIGMTINSHNKFSGKKFSYRGNIPPKFYMKKARLQVQPFFTDCLKFAVQQIIGSIKT